MPELPEVETIKNKIKPHIEGVNFTNIDVINDSLREKIPKDLPNILKNQKIIKVSRRAKYIILALDNGISTLIHLGMSGNIKVVKGRYKLVKHDHCVFNMSSGKSIIYNDPRRFGLITYYQTHQKIKWLSNLAIEPLEKGFDANYLYEITRNKKSNIKALIMNQKYVVGVGNIYACEALFLSKITPLKLAMNMNYEECEKLVINIKNILKKAILKGGSTIKDYADINGQSGYFQFDFNVYGLVNKSCKSCKSPIKRIIQSNRSTFFCDQCQK